MLKNFLPWRCAYVYSGKSKNIFCYRFSLNVSLADGNETMVSLQILITVASPRFKRVLHHDSVLGV